MNYILTDRELKQIVRESVCRFLSENNECVADSVANVMDNHRGYLLEMAFKRKEYKDKIDNLSAQIIENWCLIRHCRIYNDENSHKHWSDELKGHLLSVTRYNIKGTEKWEDREQAIREVWDNNDYFDAKTIEYVIHNKFRKENFDTNSKEFLAIIHDCINSFNTLIHLIALGDIYALYNYVDTI